MYAPDLHTCSLGQDVSVDERMVGFQGRHESKQYLPNKAHPWGIKEFIRAEAKTGYTHLIQPYRGKLYTPRPSALGQGYDVVRQLVRPLEGSHRHIVCDRFFSSPSLSHDLFAAGLYSSGTVMKNRRGLPASVRGNHAQPPRGQITAKQQGPLLLVHWQDRKPVLMLSTLGEPRYITR